MIATIASKYYRNDGNQVAFEVDERSMKDPNVQRKLVQGNYLDGTYFIIDWGYQNQGATIEISNLILPRDDYNTLMGMKQDNNYTEYLFHYINQSYPVMIMDIQKTGLVGIEINTAIQLLLTDDPL